MHSIIIMLETVAERLKLAENLVASNVIFGCGISSKLHMVQIISLPVKTSSACVYAEISARKVARC